MLQRVNALLNGAVTSGKADLFLQLENGALAALDGVAHALPRNAEVIRNFGEGKIVVVVLLHHVALLVCQNIAVEIQKIRDLQILRCHCARPPLNASRLM